MEIHEEVGVSREITAMTEIVQHEWC